MTELYIDGTSAVLPKDFSIQVKRENPLFTKNGEYTYDITLPLDNPTNAELYKHLNRLNSTQAVSTDRRAVLVADNRVYCNGTEVITGWTDDTVSVQIASGNSELNWVIGNDLQISSLEGMPEIDEITPDAATEHVEKVYPEVDYCVPMVYDRDADEVINPWWIYGYKENVGYPSELLPGDLDQFGVPVATTANFYAQPYLCSYLKQLFSALGYTLTENFLENTIYSGLFICHVARTGKWCEMLPGWSVGDFLEQIELLFNGVFVVDNRLKNVRFLSCQTYYLPGKTVHVRWVEDLYEVEMADEDDEPEVVNLLQSDVRYDLPDNSYWRTRSLPKSVKAAARKATIPADFSAETDLLTRLDAWFSEVGHQRTDTFYKDAQTGQAVFYNIDHQVEGSYKDHWQLADEFAGLERENPEQEVILEMRPVELEQKSVAICFRDFYFTVVNTRFPMPAIDGGSGFVNSDEEDTEDEEETTSIGDLIENSSMEEEDSDSASKGHICLAYYAGLTLHVEADFYDTPLPLAYTDEWLYVWATNRYMRTNSQRRTLRLTDIEDNMWEDTMQIDQQKEFKLMCHDPNLYDTRNIFEIRNKRYVCREMEFTLDANGRKGAWTGTFYPIHISDTEADARWILTDGKWRDGGVWLDNGRWLDQ